MTSSARTRPTAGIEATSRSSVLARVLDVRENGAGYPPKPAPKGQLIDHFIEKLPSSATIDDDSESPYDQNPGTFTEKTRGHEVCSLAVQGTQSVPFTIADVTGPLIARAEWRAGRPMIEPALDQAGPSRAGRVDVRGWLTGTAWHGVPGFLSSVIEKSGCPISAAGVGFAMRSLPRIDAVPADRMPSNPRLVHPLSLNPQV